MLPLLACAGMPQRPTEALRLNSYRLQTDRDDLAGQVTTVSGYLVSTSIIGDDVCLKVLVDETLRFAPELLIANGGRASDPSPTLKQVYRQADPRLFAHAVQDATRELEIRVESDAIATAAATDLMRPLSVETSVRALPAETPATPTGAPQPPEKLQRLNEIATRNWRRTISDRIGISWEEGLRKQRVAEAPLPVEEPLIADKQEHIFYRDADEIIADDNPWGHV